jgi:hypothetical protein
MDNVKEQILNLWADVDRLGINKLIEFLETSDFFTAPCSTQYHLAKPGGLAEHSLNVFNLLKQKCDFFPSLEVPDYDFPIVSTETIIVCALGHDLCKVNYYQEGGEPAAGRQLDWARELLDRNLGKMSHQQSVRLLAARCIVPNKDNLFVIPEVISKENASVIIGWLKDGFRLDVIPEFKTIYTVQDQLPLGHGEKSVSILQDFIPLTDVEKLAIRWHMANFDAGVHFNYPSGYAYRAATEVHPLVTLLFTADLEASNIVERGQ